jgi:hypothetical protein
LWSPEGVDVAAGRRVQFFMVIAPMRERLAGGAGGTFADNSMCQPAQPARGGMLLGASRRARSTTW